VVCPSELSYPRNRVCGTDRTEEGDVRGGLELTVHCGSSRAWVGSTTFVELPVEEKRVGCE
jgi:hypothetical protein